MAGLTYSHRHATAGGLIDWVEMQLTSVGSELVYLCPVCGQRQMPGGSIGPDVKASARVGPTPEPAPSEPVPRTPRWRANPDDSGWFGCVSTLLLIPMSVLGAVLALAGLFWLQTLSLPSLVAVTLLVLVIVWASRLRRR